MCGFIVTNLPDPDLAAANRYIRHRGPDGTRVREFAGLRFLHNVLSITGPKTFQPFISGDLACLFNGEIYNYRTFGQFDSDGECLIPALQEHGREFVNQLDGEFAIVLFDRKQQLLRLYTDVFATKPMHYGIRGKEFAVASYASGIHALGFEHAVRVPANSLIEINLQDGSLHEFSSLFEFKLEQSKNTFDDWEAAFSESIAKRAKNTRERIFIGLSSGYDSGSIACELSLQGVDFKSFSLLGEEDEQVLNQRMRLVAEKAESELISTTPESVSRAKKYILDHIEPIRLHIYSEGTGYVGNPELHRDGGAVGLTMVCEAAQREGRKIYISGQGADEIISDYGFRGKRHYPHSNFGGLFPRDLSAIFPWASFYGSTQAAYLTKEEYIAGSFGLETRYPFLDKKVVQAFLSLSPELKNSHYKSALHHYLSTRGFPNLYDKKVGFYPR
jgi:asparagine synthetase B (glutamine-hydrolysing)